MILGIDTSLGTAVAVVDPDGVLRAEASSADPLGHAERIGSLLAEALTAAGADGIDHVAAGMGPGPFTGLRVGIAAARAFALGRGVPVVPVVSHDAVALSVFLHDAVIGEDGAPVAVVTDARRRELACTLYTGVDDDGLPVRTQGPVLVSRDGIEEHLAGVAGVRRVDAGAVPAGMLALVAARAVAAGREVGPSEPLYLRAPDVTVSHTRKRVGV